MLPCRRSGRKGKTVEVGRREGRLIPNIWTILGSRYNIADVEVCRCHALMTMSSDEVRAALAQLVDEVRTGVLLTLRDGHPFGSHVPYVFGNDWSRVYLHLSRLALHTQHVSADPRVSLFIAEPDKPGKNPSALQRVNLQGDAVILPSTDAAYETVKQLYVLKFPQSELMFGFEDFALWELRMS